MRKIVNKSFNDDAWVSKHFEELVDRFPGQFLLMKGIIFPTPKEIPMVLNYV
jgi:hypothetical protein